MGKYRPTVLTRVREARQIAGLSLGQALRLTHFTHDYLAGMEEGLFEPSDKDLDLLTLIYGVSPDWMRGDNLEPLISADMRRQLAKVTPAQGEELVKFLVKIGAIPTQPKAEVSMIDGQEEARPTIIQATFNRLARVSNERYGGHVTRELILYDDPSADDPNATITLVLTGIGRGGAKWEAREKLPVSLLAPSKVFNVE